MYKSPNITKIFGDQNNPDNRQIWNRTNEKKLTSLQCLTEGENK